MKIIDRTRNGVTFLSADGFEAAGGVAHGFSTRLGGVSTGIYESMDLGTTRGDEPGHVRENYRRFFAAIGADADSIAMSNQIHSDLVRPVTCADVKRDLYDVEPYEAVEKMAFYGSRPEDILAAIGPGISRCCFETHEDVPNAMTSALGVCATPYIDPIENGKFKVDLKGINAMRLERAGLLPEHIAVSGDCTACHPEKYWSHRVTNGVRGSQAAVIELLK